MKSTTASLSAITLSHVGEGGVKMMIIMADDADDDDDDDDDGNDSDDIGDKEDYDVDDNDCDAGYTDGVKELRQYRLFL